MGWANRSALLFARPDYLSRDKLFLLFLSLSLSGLSWINLPVANHRASLFLSPTTPPYPVYSLCRCRLEYVHVCLCLLHDFLHWLFSGDIYLSKESYITSLSARLELIHRSVTSFLSLFQVSLLLNSLQQIIFIPFQSVFDIFWC